LERAWNYVIARHPALRASFYWEHLDKPVQVISAGARVRVEINDWRGIAPEERGRRLTAFRQSDREQGFDLSAGPLMRVAVFRVSDSSWVYIWTFHHLLLDGWSAQIVNAELSAAYESLSGGREPQLPFARSYGDYIDWLHERDLSRAKKFWRRT